MARNGCHSSIKPLAGHNTLCMDLKLSPLRTHTPFSLITQRKRRKGAEGGGELPEWEMRRTAKSQPPPPPPAEEIKVPPFTQATQSGGGEGERDAKDAAAAASSLIQETHPLLPTELEEGREWDSSKVLLRSLGVCRGVQHLQQFSSSGCLAGAHLPLPLLHFPRVQLF